jgi:hypothetical protein
MAPEDQSEPLHLTLDEMTGDRVLIYEAGQSVHLELQHSGDTFWMTQEQIASLFGIERSGVSKHFQNIFSEGELDEASVCEESSRTAADGKTYKVQHYNLDAVISVGYRVSSKQGTLFRKWATGVLVQLATKGFVVDVVRLKNPAERDHVAELREKIREIRASEANLYAELRDICRLCQDYDPKSQAARDFYSHMQAKLFWAVVSHTPSEIVAERANAAKPNMGVQTLETDAIRKRDSNVAKNYLAPEEIKELNRLTDILLSIFEDQLAIGRLTLMSEAELLLDEQLKHLKRPLLTHGGSVSHDEAERIAAVEYAKFDEIRRKYRVAETDKELAQLRQTTKHLPRTR